MKKNTFLLFLFLLFSTLSYSQLPCATPSPTPEEYAHVKNVISQLALQRNGGTTCVPIRLHIIRQSDGAGGVSLQAVNEGLAELNAYYFPAGIEFYLCGETPDYLDSDTYYEFSSDEEDAMANAANEVSNALNLYFVNTISIPGFGIASGYAYFPSNSVVSTRMVVDFTYANSSNTLVHEMGHWFSLLHTFEGTINGPSHPNAENVVRPPSANANCSDHGDLICDTPADPGYNGFNFDNNNCVYIGTETDVNGDVYAPDTDNAMSYFPSFCQDPWELTPEQYIRIEQGMISRQNHNAYSLDFAPSNVNDPSGLTASLVTVGIELSWNDNSTNEMGFLIERSTTSATSGFSTYSHFGTGPNQTTFIDNSPEPNTTHWYRVKASNDQCGDYSNVIEIISGLYCSASSSECGMFIENVSIGDINNISSCTIGGYADYSNLSTDVNINESYNLFVVKGAVFGGDQFGLWIDWNQNGEFTDANEEITFSGGPFSYNATITPPANALSGPTRLRMRAMNVGTVLPCGNQPFGETEDYTLNVIGGGNPGTIQLANLPEGIYEGETQVFNVIRAGGSDGAASVVVTSENGSATEGTDFDAVNIELSWADGEAGIKTFSVPTIEDNIAEGIENFSLSLSNAVNATLGLTDGAEINIQDYTLLSIKVKLEGPYDENTGLMNDMLRQNDVIPSTQPFSELGFSPILPGGSENFDPIVLNVTGEDAIVDWIYIEIHNDVDPFETLLTIAGLVQRDGDVVATDGFSPLKFELLSDYIVVVRHRNHLGVRSLNSFPGTLPATLDFTNPSTPIFGNNATTIINGEMVLISGNANGDSQINPIDKNDFWRPQVGLPFDYIIFRADFNMDGIVNAVDKNDHWRVNNSKIEQID